MISPLARQRAGSATSLSLPSPFGGLNARDGYDQMQPTDAIYLENWFPDFEGCVTRDGFSYPVDDIGSGAVETISEWRGPGTRDLIGAEAGRLLNIDPDTDTVTVLASGFSSDRWQTVNHSGYMLLVNGEDAPQRYNGTLATATFTGTGLTLSDLIQVATFKSRAYFVEKDSAAFWYGGVGAIGGALSRFDLGQIAQRGGALQAVGSWSVSVGDGLQDLFVAVMDTGEIIVYSGSNPGDANNWSLVGRYWAGRPIGRRCLTRLGGELIVITRSGFIPISVMLQGGTEDDVDKTVWGKINAAIRDDAVMYGDLDGWEAQVDPAQAKMYFNVPLSSGTAKQYVLNVLTGAWALFTGIPASSLGEYDKQMYFGSPVGKLGLIGGTTDDGAGITSKARTAFSYLGDRTREKRFTTLRPVMTAKGNIDGNLGINVDYAERIGAATPVEWPNTGTTPWGGPWGSPWGDKRKTTDVWATTFGYGRTVSVVLEVTGTQRVTWYATDFMAE